MVKMVKGILLLAMAIGLTLSDTPNSVTVPSAGGSFVDGSYIQYEEVTRASTTESLNAEEEIGYNGEIKEPTIGKDFVEFETAFQSPDADYQMESSAENLPLDSNKKEAEQQDADQFSDSGLFPLRNEGYGECLKVIFTLLENMKRFGDHSILEYAKIPSVEIHSESEEQRGNADLATVLEVEKYLKSRPELPTLSREDILHYIQNISEANGSESTSSLNEDSEEIFYNTKSIISEKNNNSKADNKSIMLIFPENFVNGTDVENVRMENPSMKTNSEKNPRYAGSGEEKVSEDETMEPFEESQSNLKSIVYGYPVYEAARTKSPSILAYATARSYASYDSPEMVTKSYNFEVAEHKSLQQPFNHKHDGELALDNESEKLNEKLNGAIIVLPLKDSDYNAKSTEIGNSDDLQDKKKQNTFGEWETTLSPIYVTPEKTFPVEQIEMNAEKTLSKLNDVYIPESLENFSFDDVKKDDNFDVRTVKKPSVDETRTKRKKFKRKRTKNKAGTAKNSNPQNDLLKIVEILPEDMKELLQTLNLGNGTVEERLPLRVDAEKQSQPSIDPSSFSRFKPLPLARSWEDGKKKSFDDEMKEFLASFGLVFEDNTNGRRQQKSYMEEKDMKYLDAVPPVNMEIIPEDMRHVIYNLGLANRQKKQSTDHIFNPSNHSVNQSQEETEKLKALMAIVKKIASFNGSEPVSAELQDQISQQIKELNNLSVEYKNKQSSQINHEIKQIIITNKEKFDFIPLRNFTEYQRERKRLGLDLDPVFLAESSRVKNEVKRQTGDNGSSNSASGSGSAAEVTGAEMGVNTSGELPQMTEGTSNIEALKESFGGGETASDDADVDSALPPKKPNGLYLLVDWNSFLEVGTEDDKRRVNIRFQPKIGDGRHFIPVTVP